MSTRRAVRARMGSGEIQARRLEGAAPHTTHSPGWPHLDRRGNCLCTLGCCIGQGGCRCRDCGHQSHPRETRAPAAAKVLPAKERGQR